MATEDDDTGEAIGTGNDARLKMFEQIADHAEKVMDDKSELEDYLPDDPDNQEDAQEKKAPYKLALDTEGDVVGGKKKKAEAKAEPAEENWTLKVNGQEKLLTREQVIALAQKVENADQYLQQAKEAAERFDRLALENRQPVVQELPAKPADVPTEDDLALVRALQMGTEEEAVKAVRKLRAPAIQPDVVIAQALDRLNFQNAFSDFRSTYKDISDDPNLMQLAIAKDAQLVQSGDRRTYAERYKSIGDEIRKWRGTPSESFKEKEERKSATVTNIRTAGARATPAQDDEQEESPSETIARMARARGQL